MTTVFTSRTREIISRIPRGRVTTYGIIARHAGSSAAARQVARILHSSSQRYNLPWHRVVNRTGTISLSPSQGYAEQKRLLEEEGIRFSAHGKIDFDKYLWWPETTARLDQSMPKE